MRKASFQNGDLYVLKVEFTVSILNAHSRKISYRFHYWPLQVKVLPIYHITYASQSSATANLTAVQEILKSITRSIKLRR